MTNNQKPNVEDPPKPNGAAEYTAGLAALREEWIAETGKAVPVRQWIDETGKRFGVTV